MRYYHVLHDDSGEEEIYISKRSAKQWMKEHPGSRGYLVITERDGTLVDSVPIEESGHKYRDNKVISTVTPTGRL